MQTIHLNIYIYIYIFFLYIFGFNTEYLWDKPNNCTNKKGQAKTKHVPS